MGAPDICPNCGADVPPNAKACPECGACEQTGWSEAARISGLNLPGQDFDYDEFIEQEFAQKKKRHHGTTCFWCIIGTLLAAIILIMIFWWK
jgi:hypothetical protein